MSGKLRAEAPSHPVPIRLSPRELRQAAEAAQRNHMTVSAFIREAIVSATLECLEPFPDDEHHPRCQP